MGGALLIFPLRFEGDFGACITNSYRSIACID
jgi:hypothetical protein